VLLPQVPEGSVPGQTLQATSPDGLTFAFKVPLAPLSLGKDCGRRHTLDLSPSIWLAILVSPGSFLLQS
jgi:hypothetical protein